MFRGHLHYDVRHQLSLSRGIIAESKRDVRVTETLIIGIGGGGTNIAHEMAKETARRDRAAEALRELTNDRFTVLVEDNAEAQQILENWNQGMTGLLETVNTNLARKVGAHFRMPING